MVVSPAAVDAPDGSGRDAAETATVPMSLLDIPIASSPDANRASWRRDACSVCSVLSRRYDGFASRLAKIMKRG